MRPRPLERVAKTTPFPFLIERLFNDIQTALIDNIDWLNYAYGKAERITTKKADGRVAYIPAVYNEKYDYESLMPDDTKGNYSFFVVQDSQNIDSAKGRASRIYGKCSLIVWFDLRSMTSGWGKEYAKNALLAVLSDFSSSNGHLIVESVLERTDAIFSEFTLDETDNQYLTFPFAGFRFNCEYSIRQLCSETK